MPMGITLSQDLIHALVRWVRRCRLAYMMDLNFKPTPYLGTISKTEKLYTK